MLQISSVHFPPSLKKEEDELGLLFRERRALDIGSRNDHYVNLKNLHPFEETRVWRGEAWRGAVANAGGMDSGRTRNAHCDDINYTGQ